MKTQHTDRNIYLLDSDIEIWVEPDAYCPRLIIKRPKKIKNSCTVLSQTMQPFQQIIKENESLFIEDPFYNLIANPSIGNQAKLQTAMQLKELVEKIERMVQENIEEEQMDDDLWVDQNP